MQILPRHMNSSHPYCILGTESEEEYIREAQIQQLIRGKPLARTIHLHQSGPIMQDSLGSIAMQISCSGFAVTYLDIYPLLHVTTEAPSRLLSYMLQRHFTNR